MVRRANLYGRRLVIFVKAPELGRVKTRLAKDLGPSVATSWYRTNCRRIIDRLSRDRRWQTYLAVTPDRADRTNAWPGVWPPLVPRIAQGGGDLGAKMSRIFQWFPPGPVVIVGSDIPGIEPHHVSRAFEALGRTDAVIGPSSDGGYWLIGLKRRGPLPLDDVRWSTEFALEDTKRNLQGRRVAFLTTLDDVDTSADLARI